MSKEKSAASRQHRSAPQKREKADTKSHVRVVPAQHPLLHWQQVVGNAKIARMLVEQEMDSFMGTRPEVGLAGGVLSETIAARIQAQRGQGTPLDPTTREEMEDTFGSALDDVRIHTDAEANALSHSINAKAFTIGADIFFHQTANPRDSRLLAHEITHVLQQRSMSDSGPITVGPANDPLERQAEQIAAETTHPSSEQAGERYVDPAPANATPAGRAVQRSLWDLLSGASGPVGLGVSAITGLAEKANRPLATLAGVSTRAMTEVPGAGTLGGLGKVASPIGLISGAMDLFGSNKTAGERVSGGLGAFSGLTGVAGDMGEFFGTSALSAGGAEGLSAGAGAALTGELGAGAAASSAGAVIGAGLAGYGIGRLLDTGVGAIGQAITGNKNKDYTISGGIASLMTSADQSVSRLWADPSKPAYTQTLGWKLGEWLGI